MHLSGSINTNKRRAGAGRARGFSLLELVVVIGIISALLALAIPRLWPLQVDAERVAMEHVLGALRSALGIKVAEHLARGDIEGIRPLEGSNPMDRLAEAPKNYLGVLNAADAATVPRASWYFDAQGKMLVYRVRNEEYFQGAGSPTARFAVELVYETTRGRREIAGVRLVAVGAYQWLDQPR